MPFTVSHAAAVLPFRRTRLPWSALVIGSFGPDFQYFLRMSSMSRAWHYYPDVLLYCFPFCVLVYFVFESTMRRPLIELLPAGFQHRLSSKGRYPDSLRDLSWLLCAICLGIGTHMLWDSLTHPHTWFSKNIPVLRQSVALPLGHHKFGWELAQGGSTLLGLFLLAVFLLRWYQLTPDTNGETAVFSPSAKFLLSFFVVTISLCAGWWHAYQVLGLPPETLRDVFDVLFVVSVITWFLWLLFAYCVVFTLVRKAKGAQF